MTAVTPETSPAPSFRRADGAPLTELDEAAICFADPTAYADEDRWFAAAARLRAESPVHRIHLEGLPPFHVVTRHADVFEIATHSDAFKNEPRAVLQTLAMEELMKAQGDLKTLIHIDDPRHKELRGITLDWFKPRSLGRLEERIGELAKAAVDRWASSDGVVDVAREIAMPFPLQVILSILGLPEDDYDRMLTLTQELFGGADPELSRGFTPEEMTAVITDFFGYFAGLVADRQAHPTEDLASVIANATVDGQPIDMLEQLSYYVIIATAGHDTTSASLSGGIRALAEHPDQLARLQADPSLLPTAIEEIIRWVTPVKHFLRNAVVPYEVGGVGFEPGDCALLSYWSANRDDTVFGDPTTFDVGRTPNRHLAFGFGAHYCLGASLARMELKAFLTELLPRLERLELAGDPALSASHFVSTLKHLPVEATIRG
jgi:cytochrome P450